MTVFLFALQGASVAHFAAMATDTATLRLLMEWGIRLDVRDHKGKSPIHLAAGRGHLDSVKLLVEEAGVDLWLRDAPGMSSLDLAAHYGHLEIVRYLIEERGMDPSEADAEVGLKGPELAEKAGGFEHRFSP